jgi:hypothetical protein
MTVGEAVASVAYYLMLTVVVLTLAMCTEEFPRGVNSIRNCEGERANG